MPKDKDFRLIESRKLYSGRIVGLEVDRIEINGKEYWREVVRHPGGVVVLGVLPDGRIPFVRQHRYPMDRDLLELPAGKIDAGEDPLRSAAREMEEETGYQALDLQRVCSFYPTPGFCDELLHLFFSDNLVPGRKALEEDEILEVERLSFDEALALAQEGEILDGKTLLALYWRASGVKS